MIDPKNSSHPLRLDVEYPTNHILFRISEFVNMSRLELAVNWILYKQYRELLRSVRIAMGAVLKIGGPIEIYIKNLLPVVAKVVRNVGLPFTDRVLLEQFLLLHSVVYIHELLHRMWHYESIFEQNSKRRSQELGKDKEEEIITEIAFWICSYIEWEDIE